MRKLNKKKIKWIIREMDNGKLSVCKIARIQKITPRWTRELYRKFGICVASSEDVVKKSDIIIIAVKPQDFKKLLKRISSEINNTKHIISVMAGVTISRIESLLKRKVAITRAMPNMAALVGKSITCISYDKNVKNKIITQRIFSSIGEILEIDRKSVV